MELFGTMQFLFVILALGTISDSAVKAKSPSKIVGGKRVDIKDAPYTVMIRHSLQKNSPNGHICGGTIISERYILTAAHCFEKNATDPSDPSHPSWFRVVAGKNSYHPDVGTYEIEQVYIHPNFTGDFYDDDDTDRADIAVIKLKNEIPPSETHKMIELANKEPARGSPGSIFGWGHTIPNIKSISATLQELTGVTVADFHFCAIIAPEVAFPKDALCVITSVGSGLCEGDSGGPLVVDGALAGVITSGIDCKGEYPGVVANVAYHKSWIEDAVRGLAESLSYSANNIVRSTHDRPKEGRRKEPLVHHELSSWHLLTHELNEATVAK